MTFTDLSDLPRARGNRDGLVPDAEPRFIGVLVDAWAAEKDDNKPTALGTPFRHSDAGKCARYLSYVAAGLEPSDPMDLSGVWNTSLGTLLHDLWQAALRERYPDAEIEVKVRTVDADGSGHIDACITDGDRLIAYELKTIGGYGYKAAVGAQRKGTPAEGPKAEHLLQAAINGISCGADEVVVGYLAKETISVNVAARFGVGELERFCCEWTFTREQVEELARNETKRVSRVLELAEEGKLAPRRLPDMPRGAEIQDPSSGAWTHVVGDETVEVGTTWACGYCKFQTHCASTEPGIVDA